MNTTVHGCQVRQQQQKKQSCETRVILRSELVTKFDDRYSLPKQDMGLGRKQDLSPGKAKDSGHKGFSSLQ